MSDLSEQLQLSTTDSKALELLGSGLSQSAVASHLGLSEARISQLMAEEDFRNAVVQKRFERAQQFQEDDVKLDNMERKVVDRLNKAIALCHKPMELARIFETLNRAKRRTDPAASQNQAPTQVIVQLNLPTALVQQFRKNGQSQIVEVDGMPLVTAQSTQLATMKLAPLEETLESVSSAQEINHNETLKLTSEQLGKTQSVESRGPRKSNESFTPGSKFCAEDL